MFPNRKNTPLPFYLPFQSLVSKRHLTVPEEEKKKKKGNANNVPKSKKKNPSFHILFTISKFWVEVQVVSKDKKKVNKKIINKKTLTDIYILQTKISNSNTITRKQIKKIF
jgi:hypothetical protein